MDTSPDKPTPLVHTPAKHNFKEHEVLQLSAHGEKAELKTGKKLS